MMKRGTSLPGAAAFACAAIIGAGRGADPDAKGPRPNIVFILADDLGWRELGCYGNAFNETPALDVLARDGIRFTDAYAAAPVCSPTRAAFLTGQAPARVGITDYLRPDDAKHLSTEHVTLAETLKEAGYATGIIGKWHLTGYANHGAEEVPPAAHGFDETIVSENRGIGGGSYFHPYHFNREIVSREIERRLPEKEFLVDRLNLEAVEFIRRHCAEPFFLYLSHYAVHTVLAGRPDLVAKYEAEPGAGKGPRAPRNNPHLAAQLESIDRGVAMIRETLAEEGLAERTILIFMGDNGGETNVTTNAPLRAGKSTLYEGGIRVPLIIRAPGARAGAICRAPVSTIDLYPTLCALAGVEPDPSQRLDGVSIAPLLADPERRLDRDLFWHYPLERPHFLGGRSAGAIRRGDWKLIEFYDTGACELYDLAGDIGEAKDLAAEDAARVAEMRKALAAWRESCAAGRGSGGDAILIPEVEGEWWTIAGDPDLGDYTDPEQQPVDFAIWQAADGTWQLWSCIRGTKCGGTGRLFHRWEGPSLEAPDWKPMGIAMEADPSLGETPGGLQAPHVVRDGDLFIMFYGDWENICLATGRDGKVFERRLGGDGMPALFTEGRGNNTRDAMAIRIGSVWHCYYTAFPERKGAVYCRTSKDLRTWSASTRVAFGGSAGTNPYAAECPHVVCREGSDTSDTYYYLFRTQRYGRDAQTSVYRSEDPLDFGIEDDRHLVCRLPVAAPEIIRHGGRDYIACLLPSLKGIRVARLRWVPKR
ncbi:MAG: sulfatase-like hydrolase/transferase [Planctomycetes bacterium]|nr:sulfatase-like hydrolase/transferase [Planctomycetota bacterium]